MKSARIAKLRLKNLNTPTEELARRILATRSSLSIFKIKQRRLLKRIGI